MLIGTEGAVALTINVSCLSSKVESCLAVTVISWIVLPARNVIGPFVAE